MRPAPIAHTLLMRNVPLSLSRSRSLRRSGRKRVACDSIHLQTVGAEPRQWMAADAAIGGGR